MNVNFIFLFFSRLYCGAACSQSIVKFFLKMVKVGGFLIAPVGFRVRQFFHSMFFSWDKMNHITALEVPSQLYFEAKVRIFVSNSKM